MTISRRPGYYEAQEREWQPIATYALLGTMVGIFLLQQMTLIAGRGDLYVFLFVADMHWLYRPWTLITATLSHANVGHILLNGLVLFFFGPILERLIGRSRYVALFFISGAIASVAQVYLTWYLYGQDNGGLGASGALNMVMGALVIVMPKEKILIWGIIPVPFWIATIGFALLDIVGALNPASGIGNFAHLSGLAIGLWVGWRIREQMKKRGMRLAWG